MVAYSAASSQALACVRERGAHGPRRYGCAGRASETGRVARQRLKLMNTPTARATAKSIIRMSQSATEGAPARIASRRRRDEAGRLRVGIEGRRAVVGLLRRALVAARRPARSRARRTPRTRSAPAPRPGQPRRAPPPRPHGSGRGPRGRQSCPARPAAHPTAKHTRSQAAGSVGASRTASRARAPSPRDHRPCPG